MIALDRVCHAHVNRLGKTRKGHVIRNFTFDCFFFFGWTGTAITHRRDERFPFVQREESSNETVVPALLNVQTCIYYVIDD